MESNRVVVLVGFWKGTLGKVEDKIPGTEWFNVRVSPDLRLVLYKNEFCPIGR